MINIPYIKIPQIGIGGIPSTLNVYPAQEGSGNVPNNQPTPITYLTQWAIVGNSEVHGNEIWSCGEYNATDGKYHILVQPLGGSIADIALTEPLRKVNDVADSIEFPSGTEGKALVTRRLGSVILGNVDTIDSMETNTRNYVRWTFSVIDNIKNAPSVQLEATLMCATLTNVGPSYTYTCEPSSIGASASFDMLIVYKEELAQSTPEDVRTYFSNTEVIYELATPTTELVDAPQIEEADSYSMVISQGAKAVEWSSFETEVIP